MRTVNKKQQGFSMIEVLVSLIVIGVGMLGLTSLQIASLKSTNNAHSRNTAVMLAMEFSDRMRANPLGVSGGFYDNNVNCTTNEDQCKGTATCTPQAIARADVQELMCGTRRDDTSTAREGGASNLLPGGTLDVSCVGDCAAVLAEHNIALTWSTAKLDDDQDDSDLTQSVTVPVTP